MSDNDDQAEQAEKPKTTRKRKAPAPKAPTTIEAALVAAQRTAPSVPKDSYNEFARFPYSSAETILRHGREHLAKHGLALPVVGWTVAPSSVLDAHANKAFPLLEVRAELVHESGEVRELHLVWPIVPKKGRDLDNAVASAVTRAKAYLVSSLLLLDRVEPGAEPDHTTAVPVSSNAVRSVYSDPGWQPYKDRLAGYSMTLEILAEHLKEKGQPAPENLTPEQWNGVFAELEKSKGAKA